MYIYVMSLSLSHTLALTPSTAYGTNGTDTSSSNSLLDRVQWINDLIDATYPDGHASARSENAASVHVREEYAAHQKDVPSSNNAANVGVDTHEGSLLDKVEWINDLIDATYPDGHPPDSHSHPHSHDGGVTEHIHAHSHPHQGHDHEDEEGNAVKEAEGASFDSSTSLLANIQWINDLIDATYPDGHAPAHSGAAVMHAHPHSHDGGETEHTHDHVSTGEHHNDGHAKEIAASANSNKNAGGDDDNNDDDDDEIDDDTVSVTTDAKALEAVAHGHGHSAGSAGVLQHNPLQHDNHDHHESGPKEGEEKVDAAPHSAAHGDAHDSSSQNEKAAPFRTRMLKQVRRQLREHPLHSLPFNGQASGGNREGHINVANSNNNNNNNNGDRGIGMDSSIFDILPWLQRQPQCENKPIFLSMAHVVGEMYWQLIENFVYTLVKFEMSDCSIMICVDDLNCMQKCKENDFPCYLFEYEKQHANLPEIALLGAQAGYADPNAPAGSVSKPSVMELIAYLKLYHIPKALQNGLGAVAVLDLDVGFLESPQSIVDYMYDLKSQGKSDSTNSKAVLKPQRDYKHYNNLEALVQQDVTFIMNRSEAGWKQWWTEPMPNIGVLLLKSTPKVVQMFEAAWRDYYKTAKKDIRKNPGKDQNKVVLAMQRHGGGRGAGFGSDTSRFNSHNEKGKRLAWRYIPVTEAVLIDKIFKFVDQAVELGGGATADILRPEVSGGVADMEFMHKNSWQGSQGGEFEGPIPKASVVHVTCFEKGTKLMGLKAANAFWNPFYYDPMRPTITKKLLAFNKFKGGSGSSASMSSSTRSTSGKLHRADVGYLDVELLEQEIHSLVYLALKLNRTLIIPNVLLEKAEKGTQLHNDLYYVDPQKSNTIQRPDYKGNTIWPGFRVLNLNTLHNDPSANTVLRVKQVEPAYYWRVKRDYAGVDADAGAESSGVPEPTVVTFTNHKDNDLAKIEETLSAFSHEKAPRLVVHNLPDLTNPSIIATYGKISVEPKIFVSHSKEEEENLASIHPFTKGEQFVKSEQAKMKRWAEHSVGDFDSWKLESQKYVPLASLKSIMEGEKKGLGAAWGGIIGGRADHNDPKDREYIDGIKAKHVMENSRLCANIGERMRGNRSCFGKCG